MKDSEPVYGDYVEISHFTWSVALVHCSNNHIRFDVQIQPEPY